MVKLNENSVAASFCSSEMKMVISKNKKDKIPTTGEYDSNNTYPPEAGKVDIINS